MNISEVEALVLELCIDNIEEARCETYEDAGILTSDRGVVLELGKDEFQITIVRSKGNAEQDD